jgi:hypothetical protein
MIGIKRDRKRIDAYPKLMGSMIATKPITKNKSSCILNELSFFMISCNS